MRPFERGFTVFRGFTVLGPAPREQTPANGEVALLLSFSSPC